MDWNNDINLSRLKFTSRLIVERAIARGWKIASFQSNPAIFLLYVPGREKPLKLFSASPPQMSYPASKIAKDKFITNQILAMNDLPVPKELLISSKDKLTIDSAKQFLADNGKIVVKPLDASHGKGITVDVLTHQDLEEAINSANRIGNNSNILLQQQIEGVDIRVVCIGYEFADAISRIPASVVGDGEHTVRELICITNSSDDRGINYKSRLNEIPMDKVEQYLGLEKMNTVPDDGKDFQVIGVSNVGMGGVRYNIKSDIPEFLKEVAVKCAKELELPVCGVDFMVKRLPKIADSFDDLGPFVIEVNECPMLTMYDDLKSFEQYEVIDKYLDFVATSTID